MLGVATRIEIDVLPAYFLEEKVESHRFDEIAERWEELVAANRHVEFFVFPYGDYVVLKTLNPAPAEGPLKHMTDMDDRAIPHRLRCVLGRAIHDRLLQPHIVTAGVRQRRVGPAYQIFPSDRTVRFEEMEYEMPYASGWTALHEAIAWIKKNNLPVTFPFEFRAVAGDDIWLSPMNNGPCLSISMHQYARMNWKSCAAVARSPFFAHMAGARTGPSAIRLRALMWMRFIRKCSVSVTCAPHTIRTANSRTPT